MTTSPSLSPNNREPFPISPSSPPSFPEFNGLRHHPYRTLPPNALQVINDLQKKLDSTEYELLHCTSDRNKFQQQILQNDTYIMELEGEIIRYKNKVGQMEEAARSKEIAWNSDYSAMLTIINDLKAEGIRRYMKYLDYRSSILLPTQPMSPQNPEDAIIETNRRD